MSIPSSPTPAPILVSIPDAAIMIARSRGFIYEAISTGKITAVKSDGRTLVVVASLHEYADKLPPAKLKLMAKRQPERLRTPPIKKARKEERKEERKKDRRSETA